MNLSQIGLFPDVVQAVNANQDVKNFICSSAYFVDLVAALNKFLKPVSEIKQSYVGSYSDVPYGCSGKPFLIFTRLTDGGNAAQHTRIAYLPLFKNVNEVSVFFPNPIVNPNCTKQMRTEPYGFKNDFDHFEIPIVLSEFIKNPSHFLSLAEIEKRVKGKS